jgi:hypothetical protein
MATRTNACSELTRFWLEARHGCLVGEGIPVKVPYAHSDIDLMALHPHGHPFALPTGAPVGPRLIVETKDEHDWDVTGREFGQLLRADVARMDGRPFVPRGAKGVRFSMLREEHFDCAAGLFGDGAFDRLFVVHAIDPTVLAELGPALTQRRIHWLTVPELVRDLLGWYRTHQRQTTLRNTLVGDLFHLLVGFCGLRLPDSPAPTRA